MPVLDRNLGVGIDLIHLGQGGYANDAAATAAWRDIARRTPGYAVTDNPPGGTLYYNTGTAAVMVADGAGAWAAIAAAAAGHSFNAAYDGGQTVTQDAGAITFNDSDAAAADVFAINRAGASSGHVFNVDIDAAVTGNVLDVGFSAAGTGTILSAIMTGADPAAQGISIDAGTLALTTDGWGFLGDFGSGVVTGAMVALTDGGAATGDFIDITTVTATATRLLDLNIDTALAVPAIDIDLGAAGSGHVIDIAAAAAWTGNYLELNLTNALAAAAINVSAAGARVDSWFEVTDTSSSAVPGFLYTLSAGGPPTAPLMQFDSNGQAFADGMLEFLLDGTTGASSAAIIIDEESAARTGYGLWVRQSGTGSSQGIAIDADGAGATGNALDIDLGAVRAGNAIGIDFTAAATGNALDIDMNVGDVGAGAINILGGGARAFTDALIDIDTEAAGHSGPVFDINVNGVANSSAVFDIDAGAVAGTGNVFEYNVAGAWNADVFAINLTNANAASQVLVVADDALNHSTEGWLIQATNTGTGAGDWLSFAVNGASTGHVITVDTGAVDYQGHVLNVAYDNATLQSSLINCTTGTGLRSVSLIQITDTSVANVPVYNHDIGGILAAPAMQFDVNADVQQPIVDLLLGAQTTGGGGIHIDAEGGNRAGYGIQFDWDTAGAGQPLDIDVGAAGSFNCLDVSVGAFAYSGNVINIALGATATAAQALVISQGAVVQAANLVDIGTADTGATHLFALAATGARSGNHINLLHTGSNASGDAIGILMDGANAGAQALVIDTNVAFSSPLVQIISDTGSPTASCIDVATTSLGAAGVAAALTATGNGALAANADLVRLNHAANAAASSNILAIEATAGTHAAGSLALYIDAGADSMEAIHVDRGTVVFDETLSVVSSVTVGSGAATTSIASGGAGITYGATARPTKSIYIPARLWEVGADTGAAAVAVDNNVASWALDGAGVADEGIRTAISLPWDYANGTNLTLHIYCYKAAAAGGTDVVLHAAFLSQAAGADMTAGLTAGTITGALTISAQDILTILSDANLVINGATLASGELLLLEIIRDPNEGADDLADDLLITGVRIDYTADAS